MSEEEYVNILKENPLLVPRPDLLNLLDSSPHQPTLYRQSEKELLAGGGEGNHPFDPAPEPGSPIKFERDS